MEDGVQAGALLRGVVRVRAGCSHRHLVRSNASDGIFLVAVGTVGMRRAKRGPKPVPGMRRMVYARERTCGRLFDCGFFLLRVSYLYEGTSFCHLVIAYLYVLPCL